MAFSTATLAVSIVGLLALFSCKALEMNHHLQTPLTSLRRVADPLLARSWRYFESHARRAARNGLHFSLVWASASICKLEAAFYKIVHGITARLNQFLRARRSHIRRGNEVSAHLKTVLEKADKDAGTPDSFRRTPDIL